MPIVLPTKAEAVANLAEIAVELKGMNIFITGMMGCGKTTVGKELASCMTGYSFLDTDQLIEARIGMSIAQYFQESGESAFRAIETAVLAETAAQRSVVVSTGGGVAQREENLVHMKKGIIVFIDVSAASIYERLLAEGPEAIAARPLLQGPAPLETLRQITNERRVKYNERSDVRLPVGGAASRDDVLIKLSLALDNFLDTTML